MDKISEFQTFAGRVKSLSSREKGETRLLGIEWDKNREKKNGKRRKIMWQGLGDGEREHKGKGCEGLGIG